MTRWKTNSKDQENVVALKRAGLCVHDAHKSAILFGLLGLLGQQNGLDVGQDTSLGDGHAGKKLVQLLVVADGQLQVTWDDPGLLVVTGGVACQLEHFSGQVLHDGSQVDWGSSSDPLGIVSLTQQTVDPANRELQTSTG